MIVTTHLEMLLVNNLIQDFTFLSSIEPRVSSEKIPQSIFQDYFSLFQNRGLLVILKQSGFAKNLE